jgi:hypothetical protein
MVLSCLSSVPITKPTVNKSTTRGSSETLTAVKGTRGAWPQPVAHKQGQPPDLVAPEDR